MYFLLFQSSEAGIPAPTAPTDTTETYLSGEQFTVDKLFSTQRADQTQVEADLHQKQTEEHLQSLRSHLEEQIVREETKRV